MSTWHVCTQGWEVRSSAYRTSQQSARSAACLNDCARINHLFNSTNDSRVRKGCNLNFRSILTRTCQGDTVSCFSSVLPTFMRQQLRIARKQVKPTPFRHICKVARVSTTRLNHARFRLNAKNIFCRNPLKNFHGHRWHLPTVTRTALHKDAKNTFSHY